MIVEMRKYILHPGSVPKYYALYDGKPREMQMRILGNLIGFYSSEIGEMNQLVHLWGYDSFEERMRRRELLSKEPEWREFAAQVLPLVVRQDVTLLNPAPFMGKS